ncbi:MAG: NAD-dependent epimerase/dehydratase family protein [Spirochaetes bacterium]|nr:NAD-dependent epimerase/dehydratase family protein [Spirochaetota bacterium]
MKAFITGGTGFIGRHLARRMAQTEHEMICLARKTSDTAELRELGANIVIGDVTDRASIMDGMRGCDWVFNLANVYSFWEPDRDIYRRVNVEGTRNVMECALESGVSKVVHVSTIAVWGKTEESPFNEDTPPAPTRNTEYALTKFAGDQIARQLHRERGLPLVVVYPGAVVGSGDPKLTGASIKRLIERRMPATVFGNVFNTYVHVRDVAEALVRAAEKDGNIGEKYIIGNTRLTLGQFFALVGEVSGVAMPGLRMPDAMTMLSARVLTWIADLIKRPPLLDISLDAMRMIKDNRLADGGKAERELGLVYTPIRKAIEDEYAWYIRTSRTSARPWAGAERRAARRKQVDLPCDVVGLAHGQVARASARVSELSLQGMFVKTKKPFDQGSDASVTAVRIGTPFRVSGIIMRSTDRGMAVRFSGTIPRMIEAILSSGG